jgi:hypothetical protein
MSVIGLPKLGIIAGGEDLPKKIIEACKKSQRPYFVVAFDEQTDPETVQGADHIWVRVGAVGKVIKALRDENVEELVLAGPLHRPSWSEIRPDAKGVKWLAKLAKHAFGDDSLLRTITKEIEQEGFRVIGAADILGNELLAGEGLLTKTKMDEQAKVDMARGLDVANLLGAVDVGQSVIVQQGMILGVEAVEGTNALIQRTHELHRPGQKPVLIKICKPGQDRRVDLPTIGPRTIDLAVKYGIRGIVVEAGAVQIIHMADTLALADKSGIFIYGVKTR